MERTKSRRYNPAEYYAPLADPSAPKSDVINVLLEQAAPALPVRVLRTDERQEAIEEILSVLQHLHSRYDRILRDNNLSEIADRFKGKTVVYVDRICRAIEDPEVRGKMLILLSRERDSLNADFLERLGFLPENLFSREQFANEEVNRPQAGLFAKETEDEIKARVRFGLLSELYPPWFIKSSSSYPEGQVEQHEKFMLLDRWMEAANKHFQSCVKKASDVLLAKCRILAKDQPSTQPWETVSDFSTKSFAALIEIALDNEKPLRSRFEAMRLLEHAIGIFSVESNPIFQAQQAVHANIHELLAAEVWTGEFIDILPDPVLIRSMRRELPKSYESRPPAYKARVVSSEIEEALEKRKIIDGEAARSLIFESREKNPASAASKLFLMQELVRKADATLKGIETDIDEPYAKRKLSEFRSRMERRHNGDDIEIKPVGFDILDDAVGFAVVINLGRKIDQYRSKGMLDDVMGRFSTLGLYLADKLNLYSVSTDNLLCDEKEAEDMDDEEAVERKRESKSSSGFRVFKIHGEYPIETEVFREGKLVKVKLRVPVEIQILPMETYLRKESAGDASVDAYEARKANDAARRLVPIKISGRQVFQPLYDEPSMELSE